MPLLEIELVGGQVAADAAQRIADAAAKVFEAAPQTTWVRVRTLAAGEYAENGGAEPGVAPVFVTVRKRANPQGETLRAEARSLTEAVARVCGRPKEQVHVCYEPAAAGRQAFGGELVEEDAWH